MPPDIKFCGITRPQDAERAVALGAAYVGVIFANGPRRLTSHQARAVVESIPRGAAKRVGVFGGATGDEVLATCDAVGLDVIQLHGDAAEGEHTLSDELREWLALGTLRAWRVVHVAEGSVDVDALRRQLTALAARLDGGDPVHGVLLDAKVAGLLGGTGRTFDWAAGRDALATVRGRVPIILAGGLRPENVTRAVEILRPDVVDVSSGVESAPGIKDHARMRAFVDAVRDAHDV